MVSIVFGVANVGNPVISQFENFAYVPSSNTRRRNDQCRQRARAYKHAQSTRNDILQDVGAIAERLNHPGNLWVTPMADRFDYTESILESAWSIQCLWVEYVNIESVFRRVTIWWHGAGARTRLAATLF